MAESMKGLRRTAYCGTFREEHAGQEVTVFGWVQRQRDLGQLIFVFRICLQQLRIAHNHRQRCLQFVRSIGDKLLLLIPGCLHRLYRPPRQ